MARDVGEESRVSARVRALGGMLFGLVAGSLGGFFFGVLMWGVNEAGFVRAIVAGAVAGAVVGLVTSIRGGRRASDRASADRPPP